MTEQEKSFDIEKTMVDLQVLGISLKVAICHLPDSAIKEYLMMVTSKIVEFKTVDDFYYLQNKISRMVEMVIRWGLDGEILELLEETSVGIKKIVLSVEREREA